MTRNELGPLGEKQECCPLCHAVCSSLVGKSFEAIYQFSYFNKRVDTEHFGSEDSRCKKKNTWRESNPRLFHLVGAELTSFEMFRPASQRRERCWPATTSPRRTWTTTSTLSTTTRTKVGPRINLGVFLLLTDA